MGKLSRGTEYVLTTDTGAPWSASNIKLRMRSLKARAFPAGDPGRTFHDIRGTAISRLYDAGCTDAEVASVDGHQIGRGTMLGRYAKRSRQLALNAFQRWTAAEFTTGGVVIPLKRG
jgi:integrase